MSFKIKQWSLQVENPVDMARFLSYLFDLDMEMLTIESVLVDLTPLNIGMSQLILRALIEPPLAHPPVQTLILDFASMKEWEEMHKKIHFFLHKQEQLNSWIPSDKMRAPGGHQFSLNLCSFIKFEFFFAEAKSFIQSQQPQIH